MTTSILGGNLRYLRHQNHISQRELGNKVGCCNDVISNIELTGYESKYLPLIAAHFGVSEFTLKYVYLIPDNRKKWQENAICRKIEEKLIDRGHCIDTKAKFVDQYSNND